MMPSPGGNVGSHRADGGRQGKEPHGRNRREWARRRCRDARACGTGPHDRPRRLQSPRDRPWRSFSCPSRRCQPRCPAHAKVTTCPTGVICRRRLRITFKDPTLLRQALVHTSYLNENPGIDVGSNERLEFLGDAALGVVVAHELYQRIPGRRRGQAHRTARAPRPPRHARPRRRPFRARRVPPARPRRRRRRRAQAPDEPRARVRGARSARSSSTAVS